MYRESTVTEWYKELVEMGLFTEEELKLLTDINGLSIQTLSQAILKRYGYRYGDYYYMNKVTRLIYELVENGLFTAKELQLLTDINGYTKKTLDDAIYSRYGYRDYEQMKESENDER